jgi:hypothetical protein
MECRDGSIYQPNASFSHFLQQQPLVGEALERVVLPRSL